MVMRFLFAAAVGAFVASVAWTFFVPMSSAENVYGMPVALLFGLIVARLDLWLAMRERRRQDTANQPGPAESAGD